MKKRHKIEQPKIEREFTDFLESSSSSSSSEEGFCLPEDCPEVIETPRYPSPTSCMPEEHLHELEQKIERANRLLLDLGLSEEQPELGRRMLFDGLFGKKVKIKVKCYEGLDPENNQVIDNLEQPKEDTDQTVSPPIKKLKKRAKKKHLLKKGHLKKKHRHKKRNRKSILEGTVQLVGSNFVQLSRKGKMLIIPFSKICVVITKWKYHPHQHTAPFINSNSCLRRELTFNFGETVAGNPDLIQFFFRIKLSAYLKSMTGKKITVFTESGKVQGILEKMELEDLFIESQSEPISVSSICYILQ